MKKYQVFIAVDSLVMGGIQKSLLAFLQYISSFCDIDVVVWHDRWSEMVELPAYVNRIHVIGTESVRAAYNSYGIFSKDFIVSALAALREKRWLTLPRIKKDYDIAIAYSHVSSLKYYIVDKVSAKKKYAFFHHGVYDIDNQNRHFDSEYYPRYDKVFAVSSDAEKVLMKAIPGLCNVSVIQNLVDIKSIKESGKEPCPEYPDDQRLKLLTVGRLSPEKNPLRIIETARLLDEKEMDFIWMVVGDGELRDMLKSEIEKNHLEGKVFLIGNQSNPYKFMSRCDVYLQFSLFEADSITVREVAIFNKPMILSEISRFQECHEIFSNIQLISTNEDAVRLLMLEKSIVSSENDLSIINEEICRTIDREIFENVYEKEK